MSERVLCHTELALKEGFHTANRLALGWDSSLRMHEQAFLRKDHEVTRNRHPFPDTLFTHLVPFTRYLYYLHTGALTHFVQKLHNCRRGYVVL